MECLQSVSIYDQVPTAFHPLLGNPLVCEHVARWMRSSEWSHREDPHEKASRLFFDLFINGKSTVLGDLISKELSSNAKATHNVEATIGKINELLSLLGYLYCQNENANIVQLECLREKNYKIEEARKLLEPVQAVFGIKFEVQPRGQDEEIKDYLELGPVWGQLRLYYGAYWIQSHRLNVQVVAHDAQAIKDAKAICLLFGEAPLQHNYLGLNLTDQSKQRGDPVGVSAESQLLKLVSAKQYGLISGVLAVILMAFALIAYWIYGWNFERNREPPISSVASTFTLYTNTGFTPDEDEFGVDGAVEGMRAADAHIKRPQASSARFPQLGTANYFVYKNTKVSGSRHRIDFACYPSKITCNFHKNAKVLIFVSAPIDNNSSVSHYVRFALAATNPSEPVTVKLTETARLPEGGQFFTIKAIVSPENENETIDPDMPLVLTLIP